MKEKDCCFCTEVETKLMPQMLGGYASSPSRIVAESGSFVALPSVSPLAAGHLLVLSKEHYTSLAQIQPEKYDEFMNFVRMLDSHLQRHCGSVLLFEHGVGSGRTGGCGITHAHLHLLPLSRETSLDIKKQVAQNYHLCGPKKFQDFCSEPAREYSYLLFGFNLDELFYVFSEEIPSQYLRRMIATAQKLPSWDWRQLFGGEQFSRTLDIFAEPMQ